MYSSTDGGNLALFGTLLRSRVALFFEAPPLYQKRSLGLHVKVGSLLNETSSFVSFVCFVKHQKLKHKTGQTSVEDAARRYWDLGKENKHPAPLLR